MIIPYEQEKKILSLTLKATKEIAVESHKYIGTHRNIRGYCKYPVLIKLPSDNLELEENFKKIPWFAYSIPYYRLLDFPNDRIPYEVIFNKYFIDDNIDVTKFDGFKELYQYIMNSNEAREAFFEDADKPQDYVIKSMLSEIVERYLYMTNADEFIPENLDEKIKEFVNEKLARYLLDILKVDIYVPICLATFEVDKIELSESIEIIRIPDEIQMSRKLACYYESSNESDVASCATHMIAIHRYCFENNKYLSIGNSMKIYTAYPLDIIDNIMAVIRVVTGYSIGYEQILSSPIGWVDSVCADLSPLYGAKTHFVNSNEMKNDMIFMPVSYIDSEQSENIKQLYKNVQKLKNDKNDSKLLFALKRLNRCMLRNDVDDMVIDATIGLETLLSGGSKGEITYTISSRIPVVFKHEKHEKYKVNECRKIMRYIYNYRSKVVHGSSLKDSDKVYRINDVDIPAENIAVDFLRQTLLFLLKNPEYVNVEKFDEYIDNELLRGII